MSRIHLRRSAAAGLLAIVLATCIYLLPPLLATRGMSVRLDTDYSALVPMYEYTADFIRQNGIIPAVNPYAGTGIPVLGDPLSAVLNPFLMIPLVLYGTDTGLRMYFVIAILLAGFSMWFFLTSIGIRGIVRVWGSILYLVSGAGAAKLASGQMENLLSFALFPLLFYSTFRHPMNIRGRVTAAIVLTLMWFSGGLYSVWHAIILISTIRFFYLVSRPSDRKTVVADWAFTLFLFFVFSLPKFYDYAVRVVPILYRNVPGFYMGSIHALLFPLLYVMPFQVSFYDRPFFQRMLGLYYNWYEYYAFISPLPFLFLLKIRSVQQKTAVRICMLLILIGALHIAVKFTYSPFNWFYSFFSPAQIFRVPQRIVMPVTSVMIAGLAVCASGWLRSSVSKLSKALIMFILCGSILWTFAVSQKTVYGMYEPVRVEGRELAAELRSRDPSVYSVAIIPCCLQMFFVEQKIPVLNYYYGWRTVESARFKFVHGQNSIILSPDTPQPKYIISDKTVETIERYRVLFESASYNVWVTDNPTFSPSGV